MISPSSRFNHWSNQWIWFGKCWCHDPLEVLYLPDVDAQSTKSDASLYSPAKDVRTSYPDTPSEVLVRLTIIKNISFREFPKWLSYPPFPLSYGKAFIVSRVLSHLGWGGPLTFTVMMATQRVATQSLFFRRLIEIAGEVTRRLTCHFTLQVAQCRT